MDLAKSKACTDDYLNDTYHLGFVFQRKESIVEIGENAGNCTVFRHPPSVGCYSFGLCGIGLIISILGKFKTDNP